MLPTLLCSSCQTVPLQLLKMQNGWLTAKIEWAWHDLVNDICTGTTGFHLIFCITCIDKNKMRDTAGGNNVWKVSNSSCSQYKLKHVKIQTTVAPKFLIFLNRFLTPLLVGSPPALNAVPSFLSPSNNRTPWVQNLLPTTHPAWPLQILEVTQVWFLVPPYTHLTLPILLSHKVQYSEA